MGEDDIVEDKIQHHDFYLTLVRDILQSQKDLVGEDVALKHARKAPLEIDANGDVKNFYGKGEDSLETLIQQFEDVWGKEVAHRKIRRAIEDDVSEQEYERLPEYIRPQEGEPGLLNRVIDSLTGSSS